MSARVLLVDNYDSFTYNLAHLLEELGAEVAVIRNDAIDVAKRRILVPDVPGRLAENICQRVIGILITVAAGELDDAKFHVVPVTNMTRRP